MKRTLTFLVLLLCLQTGYAVYAPIEGSIQAGGFNIKYTQYGAGQPLFLVHAGLQDRRMWAPQIAAFSRKFRVITFDLPVHGQTTGADTSLPFTGVISIVMDSLKIAKASFVGLSFGSMCVSEFLLAHPERVNKVVLVSPGIIGGTNTLAADSLSLALFKHIDSVSASNDIALYAKTFTDQWCIGPFRDSSVVPVATRRYIYNTTLGNRKAHKLADWQPFGKSAAARDLHSIQRPLLLIAGDKDIPYIVRIAHHIHEQVASSRLVMMKNVAHMLNMEKPVEFNREVLAFLEQP